MKSFSLLVIILVTFFQFGFSSVTTKSPDTDFEKLSADFIDDYLKWNPQSATYLGIHEYDDKVSSYDLDENNLQTERIKEYRSKLNAIDPSSLSSKNYLDYRILQNEIDKELFSAIERSPLTRNPMTYSGAIDVNIYITRDFAPIEDRVRSIIKIEKEASKIFSDARKNLEEALPKPFVETAISVAKGSADFLGKDLIAALAKVKNEALMQEFTAANTTAIKELNDYADYLEKQKLPKANNDYALGKEKYQMMITGGEFINYTPEQILAIGMKHLKEEQDKFKEIAYKIDPTKAPIEVFKEIQQDHPTAENLIPETRKNLDAIRQYLIDHHIVSLPSDVKALVKETPQYARATSFASMDTPGPFEKSTQAFYYVTPVETNWDQKQKDEWLTAFNYYTTDVVSIHEAYPGHYIQFLHVNASGASKLQKIFGSYAFSEGWAHYCEQMMIDEGFGKDKGDMTALKYHLAQLDESLLRYCRLCVSIMMHTQA